MKKITLLLIMLCCQFSLLAQLDYKQKSIAQGANYFDIINNTRTHFQELKLRKSSFAIKNKKEEKQFERWAFYWKDRIDSNGNFPSEILGYFNAGILDATGKIIAKKQKISTESWVNIGPQENPIANGYSNPPQMGRLNAFLRIKHPTDRAQDVLFVGAPNGGIWKSTNDGATWSAKLDNVAGIGVTDIKTASTTTTFANYTTKPIYVSTGDYDAGQIKSIGVLKSMDGGETFASTGLSHTISERKSLGELVVFDDNTVIVGENQFIKKTVDGGTSWTNIYDAGFGNANYGRVAYTGTNIIYSGNFDVYFSSDSGTNWTTPVVSNSQDKHAVTVGSDGDFYIQNQAGQIKKFNIGAGTFSNVGIVPGGYNSQGGYNQALLFKDNMFVTGEFNGQTSTDTGASWHRSLNGYYNANGAGQAKDGTYIHSDHHGLGVLDGAFEFWSVNDGGLGYITYSDINDKTPTIIYKSNGVVNTQLYDVAITPTSTSGNYIMANQDNDGFSKEMHAGTMQWVSASAGDGVCAVINYTTPAIKYLGGQSGVLSKANAGFSGNYAGSSWGQISGAGFIWPLEIHTTDPTILYAGGGDVYKITDATANGDIATAIAAAVNLNSGAGQISVVSTHGAGIAVVGATASKLSVDSGTSWTTIATPTGVTINSVDFDQANMATVYCTVAGYTNGSKIFKSTDSGATWTNISAGLPNIVMKEVVLKQNQGTEILFAATELGVYVKYETGDWKKLGSALPNVIVNDIDINYTEDRLVAATFGRGLWHVNIANGTLGVDEKAINFTPFSAYPSPVLDGNLNFKVDQVNASFEYKIYNVLGGIVAEGKKELNSGIINVSKLETGIYMLKAYKDGIVFPTVKFLVSNK
jgi:xyloglucan-specific exo-beta-1,4-glucanase